MKGYQSRHNKLQRGFPIERCRWVCDLLGEHWMKIGRLFAALKKDLPGLALHYVCIEGSCLLFWLALYDGWHKKSCHTNVLCKNGIDSISLSCCSGSTYKMVWLFMSFFALQKPNHPFETIFISGARLVHCSLLWTPNSSKWHCFFFSLKD